MDSNLILYDIEQFVKKYTRFMTKDIYISYFTYTQFLKQYDYLYQELEKNMFLYQNNLHYQKIIDIKKNRNSIIKLHNQKYLKGISKKYSKFLDTLPFQEELDFNRRNILFCDELELLVINHKQTIPLIISKIKYLIEIKHIPIQKLFVLINDENLFSKLKGELSLYGLSNIELFSMREYESQFLDGDTLVTFDVKYQFLSRYIMEKLFPKKQLFYKIYQSFQSYIYLNQDYQDFDTFKDYHNYMYKRMFLSRNESLKEFIEQEVKRRRAYLRTILNETVTRKEEVDIANFLYLNTCSYQYQEKESCFIVRLNETEYHIYYAELDKRTSVIENSLYTTNIILSKKSMNGSTYLEQLVYELIKRRFPLEKRGEREVYDTLKQTTMDGYFHEWITKCLIPIFQHIETNHTLKNTKLSSQQIEEIKSIYCDYQKYLEEHHYIEKNELLERISKYIEESDYEYIFLVGDIPLSCSKPYLKILSNYPEVELLKSNVKLLYDYKKYLQQHKLLPLHHVYTNENELHQLTGKFLKDNLDVINQQLTKVKKEISIYFYEDSKRLKVDQNLSSLCYEVVNKIPCKKEILIGFTSRKDMNHILYGTYFSKLDKQTLLTLDSEKIIYQEIGKLKKSYSYIVLPYLIVDPFHEDILKMDSNYSIKVQLSVALMNATKGIILLCPNSRKKDVLQLLSPFKHLTIYEE